MAKAVKLAFELNKFLYGITGTHDIRYISLLLYGVSENEFVKKYNGKFIRHILKNGKDYSFYNFWGGVKLGTCLEYNSNGRKCLDNKVITSRTNIIETLNDVYITSTVGLKENH
ncbi:hypothetical protein [Francisella salimarina]|uniref:hypothetical protein n=1 Tax=Francisella salimarina TaxID=2599927 RepID=UPI003D817863